VEQKKYEKVWREAKYREVSPGEHMASVFLEQVKPAADSSVIDFGCGTGRGALMLALMGRLKVQMLDFASNCLDSEVAQACITQPTRISFQQFDLTRMPDVSAAYGFCCDVMEHIPPQDVKTVLRNILASANSVFFGISTVPDQLGSLIGETLHLSVHPLSWWIEAVQEIGAVVHWSQETDGYCAIYCSAWYDAEELVKTGHVNTTDAVINAQVRQNILDGWQSLHPYQRSDREIILLAGGPSMNQFESEIKALRAAGAGLVTVNGAYHWAIEKGLEPSCQVVLDAREFNSRFVEPVLPRTQYLIASQAHPATFAKLPRDRTFMWHSGLSEENEALVRERSGAFYPTPGGSTVVLRAIPLLRMMGFAQIHIFGFDSCVMPDGTHHAYKQEENDNQLTAPVTCGGRTFECAPWMISQAAEFRDLVEFLGDNIELAIYGDGLIAHIIATGASLSTTDSQKD
jgi:SAM-dependent methyltransferase